MTDRNTLSNGLLPSINLIRFSTHIIFIFIGLPFLTNAQNVAKISVKSSIGCNPFTVEVIDESNVSSGTNILYTYGNSAETKDTSYTFSSPGEFYVVQTVGKASTPEDARDTVLVTVIEPRPPEFYVSNCKGTKAFLVVNDEFYEEYLIDWGDGSTSYTSPYDLNTHNYATIGTYTVTVKGLINKDINETGFANTNCSSAQSSITLINDIVEAEINNLAVTSQNDSLGNIQLDYVTNTQTSYFLEMKTHNEASFTTIDTINNTNNPSSYVVDELNTEDNGYCFRLTAFDPCDGSTKPSNEICSIRLEATAENNQNQLNWEASSQSFQNYHIIKNGTPTATISQQNNKLYADTQVNCGEVYCYVIQMEESNAMSISDTICATAFSNTAPPAIPNISATVSEGQIKLQWEPPDMPVSHYFIRRESAVKNDVLTDTTLVAQYTDATVDPTSVKYRYNITYQDECGNISNNKSAVPVLLRPKDHTNINWSSYVGWEQGTQEYVLEKYNQNKDFIEEIMMGTDTVHSVQFDENTPQKLIFRVRTIPNDNSLGDVYSNFTEVVFPSVVLFPNAFTPYNSDGLNDIFKFTGQFVSEYELYIYNRWGELIFFSDNQNKGWDGRINGNMAEPGIYIYKANFKDDTGVSFVKQGEVLLIK